MEIAWDGRVYGLVPIWHWCGCDPVGSHLVKVDLSRMLRFLENEEASNAGAQYSEHGWDFRSFHRCNGH